MIALSEFIFRGRKIEAIKLYRELSGLGLKEAKNEVEALEADLKKDPPEKFVAVPNGKGCFIAAAVLGACGVLIYWLIRK